MFTYKTTKSDDQNLNNFFLQISYKASPGEYCAFESGGISSQSGQNVTNSKTFRSRVFYHDFQFVPGNQYFVQLFNRADSTPNNSTPYIIRMYFYDKSKNYLGFDKCIDIPATLGSNAIEEGGNKDHFIFKFPANAVYVRFMIVKHKSALQSTKMSYEESSYSVLLTEPKEEDTNELNPKFEICIRENSYLVSENGTGFDLSIDDTTSPTLKRKYVLYEKIDLTNLRVYADFITGADNKTTKIRILNNFKISNFDTLTLSSQTGIRKYYVQWRGYRGSVLYTVSNTESLESQKIRETHRTNLLLSANASFISAKFIDENLLQDENETEYTVVDSKKRTVAISYIGNKAIINGVYEIPPKIEDNDTKLLYTVVKVTKGCMEDRSKDSTRTTLTKLIIPSFTAGQTFEIDEMAFDRYEHLESIEINGAVTRVGYRALAGTKIKSLILSDSLLKFESEACLGCKFLRYIVFNGGIDRQFIIGDSALMDIAENSIIYVSYEQRKRDFYVDLECLQSKVLNVEHTTVVVGTVTTLDSNNKDKYGTKYKFVENKYYYLESCSDDIIDLVVPTTVLSSDGLYPVVKIEERACASRVNLQTVFISGDMAIGKEAFAENENLRTFSGDGKIIYEEGVFKNDSSLDISSIISKMEILPNSFAEGCTNSKSYTLSSNLTQIGNRALYGTMISSLIVPASVTEIGDYALSGCLDLSTVSIMNPDFKKVGTGAFSNVSPVHCSIFVLNQSVKKIFEDQKPSFSGSNVEIILRNQVPVRPVTGAEGVRYEDSYSVRYLLNGTGNQYVATLDSASSISFPVQETDKKYTLPDYVYITESPDVLYQVNKITPGAFKNVQNINTLEFNSFVTEIPESCCDHSSVSKVLIPQSNRISIIGNYAFRGSNVTDTTCILPKATYGKGVFMDCLQLKDIWHVLDNVTDIPEEMFKGCAEAKRLILDHDVVFKGEKIFSECISISYVLIFSNKIELTKGIFKSALHSETYLFVANKVMVSKLTIEKGKENEYLDQGSVDLISQGEVQGTSLIKIKYGEDYYLQKADPFVYTVIDDFHIRIDRFDHTIKEIVIPVVICDKGQ